jgi:hypothetical protein
MDKYHENMINYLRVVYLTHGEYRKLMYYVTPANAICLLSRYSSVKRHLTLHSGMFYCHMEGYRS